MRDIVFTLFVACLVPYILRRPWIGVLTYVWLSLMTPYRFTYGFAYSFPFTAIIAACTLLGIFTCNEKPSYRSNTLLVLFIVFPLWMMVTWLFAFHPEEGHKRAAELLKTFFMLQIIAMLIVTRKQIEALVWVIVVSIGYFGAKGGIFTVLSGGGGRVYGPPGDSFLSDNNAISVAIIMVLPLMNYLRSVVPVKWIKWGLLGAMLASGMAVLGSYSRGAFLAISAMLVFLWLKSDKKVALAALILPLIPLAIGLMPSRWTDRMNTINTYEEDGSAMGRINTWKAAFHLANDRPLVGGGFEWYSEETFLKYAPNPKDVHAAHSIYFQMLGEHGYVGLLLFLSCGAVSWGFARRTIAISSGRGDLKWAADLARALQISMVGFAVGGLFVNIGYWDLLYFELFLTAAIYAEAARIATDSTMPSTGRAR